ncbi:ribosome maturation factor RimM [Candidatus Lucifugimonas marina]|jgi:16S rRNA processing protein RimM|uniref:Ribosome maturation factor RimM n=1 Tax=Candidatus Lucifugimonas marina TaxID=3038979 RepID=A0AAJ5ZDQ2_9CHLR|nr:16S rRNA processing protein RimM [SAR202 cluster bacterium JH702]MDG0868980.1 16S rRNA processing protein RimM [SAR202 cluster bacterium JH639]WFG35605.1 16S rRNA processing protein RimM [SAR202 cluster bacterium JH545]WFG39552.1 16S rRNA processing protein RimM [SAR202 cluster bacterium JH1073]
MTDSTNRSASSDENLVVVGRVRRPTGIKGAVLVEVYSGNPDRFDIGDVVIANGREYEVVNIGRSGDSTKLTFASIDSIEKADHLRDLELSVRAEDLPENPPGIYYHYEIIGNDVSTIDGQQLGTLTEILETGSNDVLIITPKTESGKKKPAEILVPVLDGVIVNVDKENNAMLIDPPDGIL